MSLPDLQEPLALLEQQDFDKAIDVLEEKVTALPAHLGAHVLLAYAHEGRQQWEEALDSWEEVHFLLPNSPLASAGKQRVLRRMDGIENGGKAPRPTEGHPARPADTAPRPPTAEASDTDDGENDDAEEGEMRPRARDTSSEESSSTPDDDGLAQLRRQAEREARQGGARPGLADAPSSSVDAPSPPAESSSTPEEQVEQFKEEESSDDLDHLIDKLESARIDPDPEAQAPPDDPAPANDPTAEDDTEEVVSETLARIHEGQSDYEKAAHIYAKLADQEPQRADEFRKKAQEMRRKADASTDAST